MQVPFCEKRMGLVADEPHGLKWVTKVLLLNIHCQYGVNPLLLDPPASRRQVKTSVNNDRALSRRPEMPSVKEGQLMMHARHLGNGWDFSGVVHLPHRLFLRPL